MHRTTASSRPTLPEDDGWAIFALAPGERDLGRIEYWEVSQERSKRRREAPRRPLVARGPASKASLALAAAAIGAPVAVGAGGAATASAHTVTASSATNLNLRRGDRGPAVQALQRRLGISADGVFGPQTARTVKAFQRSHGLVVDGIVGPVTTRALGINASSAKTVSWTPVASITLSAGAARAMQAKLGVAVDGVVGPQTRAALKAFEARVGLPADGRPDSASLRALGVDPSASYASASASSGSTSSRGGGAAIAAAMSQRGKPYQWGATGPSSFDCSGLVQWAYRQAGVSLPRTSFAMFGVGSAVSSSNIQAGDLVFFNTAGAGASDVGLAISNTQAVSATSHGVMVHEIKSGYWGSHYVGARRVA